MSILKVPISNRLWQGTLILALGYFITGTYVQAQCTTTVGYNVVWGTCSGSTQGSFAMVDASQFSGDICARILASFEKSYKIGTGAQINYGIVVDARGVNPGTTQPCGTNPWAVPQNSGYEMPPSSVVLLPSGIIQTSATWTMPGYSRIIGEGPGATILQAASGFAGDLIDMGDANNYNNNISFYNCSSNGNAQIVDCPGIAIEHLGLDGQSQANNGIVNNSAQELSYVEDVAFSNMMGTALSLLGIINSNPHGTSNNSGPYSNLSMSNVGECVNISDNVDTRGIHGLTCTTSGTPAIDVEGSNNSLEDISLTGSNGSNTDGILIGNTAAAQNNVLFNISGSGFTRLIHISGSSTSQTNCPGKVQGHGPVYNVCDITIMSVTNRSSGQITVEDDVSGTGNKLTDSHLGVYILGEPVQSGSTSNPNSTFLGNSHFTTSLNWPTWLIGSGPPTNPCPSVGSLYSVTGSGSGQTLWQCESSSGRLIWAGIE